MNNAPPSLSPGRPGPLLCPTSGAPGQPVDWLTVAALTRGAVPKRQTFRLCRDPACEVVYFGSAGTALGLRDLTVTPGFKTARDGLVCYCFLYRRSDVARQLETTVRSGVFDVIQSEVEAGNCACEVRNPSGRCCLAEVQQTIRNLSRKPE